MITHLLVTSRQGNRGVHVLPGHISIHPRLGKISLQHVIRPGIKRLLEVSIGFGDKLIPDFPEKGLRFPTISDHIQDKPQDHLLLVGDLDNWVDFHVVVAGVNEDLITLEAT